MSENAVNGASSSNVLGRRRFLTAAGVAGAAAGLTGFLSGSPAQAATAGRSAQQDIDILNFALNLEYLEAEFYLRAIGQFNGLDGNTSGRGTLGGVTGGSRVPFQTQAVREYAEEIAGDEKQHVLTLREVLGSQRVARPAINLRESFTKAAFAAGLINSSQTFNPFANELSFLLGAFIFEDVGVTAYKGAASLLLNPAIVDAAAGLLGVEAYHASNIRTVLYARRDELIAPGVTVAKAANAISDARDALDADGDADRHIVNGKDTSDDANIVPTDSKGLVFGRTAKQVLNIVYLATGSPTKGGFFPNGLNGNLR